MNIYERLSKELNSRLSEYDTPVRAEVRTLEYRGADYPFVALVNPQNGMGIAVDYSDGEWTVEFLGAHAHVPDMEDIGDYIFGNYVLPVLAEVLVVAAMPDGSRVVMDVRRVEEKEFSAGELAGDPDIALLSWSGKLPEETARRCKAYARRKYGNF